MAQERKSCVLFGVVFLSSLILWLLYHWASSAKSVTSNACDQPSYHLLSSNASSTYTFMYEDQLPADDATRLINLTDFQFLINTPCASSLFIVLVHSAPNNFGLRNLIRNTWGRHVHVYFFIGRTTFENQTALDKESNLHHDLVQGNFKDSYKNMTYKHTMLLKWVVYNCRDVQYILKVDDDTFVNVWRMEDFISNTLSPYGAEDLIMCIGLERNALVLRTYRSKWRVSFAEYPNHYYPPYCFGYFVMYSPDVVYKLYHLLQTQNKYFWIDDVFITGVLPLQLNLTLGDFTPYKPYKVNSMSDAETFDTKKHLCALFLESNITDSALTVYNRSLEGQLISSSRPR